MNYQEEQWGPLYSLLKLNEFEILRQNWILSNFSVKECVFPYIHLQKYPFVNNKK